MAFDTTPARSLAVYGSLRRFSFRTLQAVPDSDIGLRIFSPNKLPSGDEDRTDRDKAAT
jgi:hypothetical protein